MEETIIDDFVALSIAAKIAVLARTIHMETIHVRSAFADRPGDVGYLYSSSEFVHRLSGFIMAMTYNPDDFQKCCTYAAQFLVGEVRKHGQAHLQMLHSWIDEARTIL